MCFLEAQYPPFQLWRVFVNSAQLDINFGFGGYNLDGGLALQGV